MDRLIRLLGSKTVIGTTGGILTWLSTLPVIDAHHVIGGLCGLLTVAGIRDAIAKIEDAIRR